MMIAEYGSIRKLFHLEVLWNEIETQREIKRRFSWTQKKIEKKTKLNLFWIKSNSIYVYLCCLNSNERWAQLAKWVCKYAFVFLHRLFFYFIFPLEFAQFFNTTIVFFWIPLSGFSNGFTYVTSNAITTVIYRIVHFKVQRYHFIIKYHMRSSQFVHCHLF